MKLFISIITVAILAPLLLLVAIIYPHKADSLGMMLRRLIEEINE